MLGRLHVCCVYGQLCMVGFVVAVVCIDVPDNPREGAASQPVSGQDDDTYAAEFAE